MNPLYLSNIFILSYLLNFLPCLGSTANIEPSAETSGESQDSAKKQLSLEAVHIEKTGSKENPVLQSASSKPSEEHSAEPRSKVLTKKNWPFIAIPLALLSILIYKTILKRNSTENKITSTAPSIEAIKLPQSFPSVENSLKLEEFKQATQENLYSFLGEIFNNPKMKLGPSSNLPTKQAGSASLPRMEKPEINPHKIYQVSTAMSLSGSEVIELMESTEFDSTLATVSGDFGDIAISSELYITHDASGRPVPKSGNKIIQVSIAGINMAYPQKDEILIETMPVHCSSETYKNYEERMQKKWHKIFSIMQARGVETPVLPAFGMGVFLPSGPGGNALRAKAVHAMKSALSSFTFKHVYISIIGSKDNAQAFLHADPEQQNYTIHENSLFDIAYTLANKGFKVGIVNPSDREALVSGNLGQFWWNGHVALEELFMYATTMVLNNFFLTGHTPDGYQEYIEKIH